MQSYEFISKSKNSFRDFRKGKEKLINDLVTETGISWPTTKGALKDLLVNGALNETPNGKLAINPDYESFAGVYISKDTIYLSVIDFSAKEIHFEFKEFCNQLSFFYTLEEILKRLNSLKNVKAVSVSSDNCMDYMGDAKITDIILLDNRIIKRFIPKGIEYYFEKTCVTNSWKWYENCDVKDEELNVIFSFFENNCYYTIMKNGDVIQKRRYCDIIKSDEEFYGNVIYPVWNAINPNYMAFIVSSEEVSKLVNENISEWEYKVFLNHQVLNQGFELRKSTKLIAQEQAHPSETAALYAMYRYYGWAK